MGLHQQSFRVGVTFFLSTAHLLSVNTQATLLVHEYCLLMLLPGQEHLYSPVLG